MTYSKLNRKRISPAVEIYYPDRGGWFGLSILIWESNYENYDNILLSNEWGGFSDYDNLKRDKFVLEARFFVYGSLLKQIVRTSHSLKKLMILSHNIYTKWKPIMDSLKAKEMKLHLDKSKTSIHIDEFIEDKEKLKESL